MPPPSSDATAGADPLKRRLTWVSFWRAVTATVVMVLTAARLVRAHEELAPVELLSFLLFGGVYFLTLLYGLLLRRERAAPAMAWLQLTGDTLLVSGLVVLTGGGDSPFVFGYLIVEIVGAILLGIRGAAVSAIIGAFAFLAILLLSQAGVIHPEGSLAPWSIERLGFLAASNALAQVLVAVLAGWLASLLLAAGGQLREREAELRALLELQNRIVEGMTSGLLTADSSGKITFANAAAASILDRPVAALIGAALGDVIPNVLSTGLSARRAELEVTTASSLKRLGLTISSLGTSSPGTLVVFQDLTELRRVEARLNQADRLAALGKFAAQLAHEIRNPLAAMRGAAQLLAKPEGVAPAQSTTLSGILVREGDRLGGLVDDFLKFARPPSPSALPTRFDLLVSETVDMLKNDPLSAGVKLVDRCQVVNAEIDEAQLRQVVLNLVRNALSAVAGAGEVRVSTEVVNDWAQLMVWDSAGAIEKMDLDRIFEPFFTTRSSGTGLGLSTALSIVSAHGGTIDVSSSREAGTEFRVRLPLKARAG